jgi:hypothetical protein
LRCPFDDWDASAPTQTLRFYDAYNATKHDRVGAFARATLESAIEAAAALCILLVAQYGTEYLSADTTAFFGLVSHPTWGPTERNYSPQGGAWIPRQFSF